MLVQIKQNNLEGGELGVEYFFHLQLAQEVLAVRACSVILEEEKLQVTRGIGHLLEEGIEAVLCGPLVDQQTRCSKGMLS